MAHKSIIDYRNTIMLGKTFNFRFLTGVSHSIKDIVLAKPLGTQEASIH